MNIYFLFIDVIFSFIDIDFFQYFVIVLKHEYLFTAVGLSLIF